MSLTLIATGNNITIGLKGETLVINKEKSPQLFKETMDKLEKNQAEAIKYLTTNFGNIKEQIEGKTNGLFSVSNGKVVLKGTNIPIPETIVKKLQELDAKNSSILPLIRFWKKLSMNPSENARKDLYDFMTKNNIPLTENGDIVTEKGVRQKKGSYIGHLVDCHSGLVDNSVGMYVVMDRAKVNADSNQTCSNGLHVGAPDYVRKVWSSDVIIECVVNPKDVVSVPKDYNATKMRVCAYVVAGYSKENSRGGNEVVCLNDFLQEPLESTKEKMEKIATSSETHTTKATATNKFVSSEKKGIVVTITNEALSGMSASAIVKHVEEITGVKITISLKSKKAILKKAQDLLSRTKEQELEQDKSALIVEEGEKGVTVEEKTKLEDKKSIEKVLDLTVVNNRKAIMSFAKEKFNEKFSVLLKTSTMLEKTKELAKNAGYTIIE